MGNGEVRIGLIGAGRMGADHARRIHERISGAELVAIGDPDPERAHEVAASTAARAVDNPGKLIASPDVDALVIASPGSTHEPLLLAALERGLPVLCEKPLTPDAESALKIVTAEASTERRLIQLGFMRRYDMEYTQLKRTLAGQELGAPLVLHCTHRNPVSPPEFTSDMMIYDSVVHEFDTVRWLLESEIKSVSVNAPRSSTRAPDDLVDPQLVTIETLDGTVAQVEIFVNCGFGYQVRCEAVCEAGTARVGDDSGVITCRDSAWGGSITADFRERFHQAFDSEFQQWADAARRGGVDQTAANAWDGYAAAASCEAGVRARGIGTRVPISLAERPDLYA